MYISPVYGLLSSEAHGWLQIHFWLFYFLKREALGVSYIFLEKEDENIIPQLITLFLLQHARRTILVHSCMILTLRSALVIHHPSVTFTFYYIHPSDSGSLWGTGQSLMLVNWLPINSKAFFNLHWKLYPMSISTQVNIVTSQVRIDGKWSILCPVVASPSFGVLYVDQWKKEGSTLTVHSTLQWPVENLHKRHTLFLSMQSLSLSRMFVTYFQCFCLYSCPTLNYLKKFAPWFRK